MKTRKYITALFTTTLIAGMCRTSCAAHEFVGKIVHLSLPPSANSTGKISINAVEGEVCTIATDMDFKGGDYKSIAGGPEDCCGFCSSRSKCVTYSWTDYAGGTCWLKSAVTEPVVSLGVQGAIMSAPSGDPTLVIFAGDCDMPGNDLGNVMIRSDDASACYQFCLNLPDCKVVTRTNYQGGTCYFKSAVNECSYNQGASSAMVFKPY